ncbi:MAG: hypothetical protein WCG25_09930 [bacterium]
MRYCSSIISQTSSLSLDCIFHHGYQCFRNVGFSALSLSIRARNSFH